MKTFSLILVSLCSILCCPVIHAEPTEKSLIDAWEVIQKNDPKTLVFEKLGNDRYRFKTERFPFDGEMRITNTDLNDQMDEMGYVVGYLQVDLGKSQEFRQQYEMAISNWMRNNVLYFDLKEKRWLGYKDWMKNQKKKVPWSMGWGFLLGYGPLVLLIIFLFSIFRRYRKSMKAVDKSRQLMEKSIGLSEDNNKILKEILDVLKNQRI